MANTPSSPDLHPLRVVVTIILGDEELETVRALERLKQLIEDACERGHAAASYVIQRAEPSSYEIVDENPPRVRRRP